MLENRPVLIDRLKALGVFSGIAIAAVAGFELVISGSLDFATPGSEIREVAPSSYVQVMESLWTPSAHAVTLISNEPLFAGDDYTPITEETLAGGYDDRDAPDGAYPPERSYGEIEADIAALYADLGIAEHTDASAETRDASDGAAPSSYVDEHPAESAPEAVDPKQQALELEQLTAYESGLPS